MTTANDCNERQQLRFVSLPGRNVQNRKPRSKQAQTVNHLATEVLGALGRIAKNATQLSGHLRFEISDLRVGFVFLQQFSH